MNLRFFATGAIAALGLGLCALPAQAYVLGYNQNYGAAMYINGGDPILTVQTGWYSSSGIHWADNSYYGVAPANDAGAIEFVGTTDGLHDFLVFDISSLSEVTSAMLEVYQGHGGSGAPGDPGYVPGATAEQTLRLGSYAGDALAFTVDSVGNPGKLIYNALGSGTAYAYQLFGPGNDDSYVTFDVANAAFLHDINFAIENHQQYFVMGGRVGALGDPDEPLAQLSVPEPATWAMMILGFLGVGAALRTRRRSAAAA